MESALTRRGAVCVASQHRWLSSAWTVQAGDDGRSADWQASQSEVSIEQQGVSVAGNVSAAGLDEGSCIWLPTATWRRECAVLISTCAAGCGQNLHVVLKPCIPARRRITQGSATFLLALPYEFCDPAVLIFSMQRVLAHYLLAVPSWDFCGILCADPATPYGLGNDKPWSLRDS